MTHMGPAAGQDGDDGHAVVEPERPRIDDGEGVLVRDQLHILLGAP